MRCFSSSAARKSFHERTKSSVVTRNPRSMKKFSVACETEPRSSRRPFSTSLSSHRKSLRPFEVRMFCELWLAAAATVGATADFRDGTGAALLRDFPMKFMAVYELRTGSSASDFVASEFEVVLGVLTDATGAAAGWLVRLV